MEVSIPKVKEIEYSVILDLPKPKFKVYPAEGVISEKFEARGLLQRKYVVKIYMLKVIWRITLDDKTTRVE